MKIVLLSILEHFIQDPEFFDLGLGQEGSQSSGMNGNPPYRLKVQELSVSGRLPDSAFLFLSQIHRVHNWNEYMYN